MSFLTCLQRFKRVSDSTDVVDLILDFLDVGFGDRPPVSSQTRIRVSIGGGSLVDGTIVGVGSSANEILRTTRGRSMGTAENVILLLSLP